MRLIDFFNGNVGAQFHTYLMGRSNKKRFEKFYRKAVIGGFEKDFLEEWRYECVEDIDWGLHSGMESYRAYRRAHAKCIGTTKA